MKQYKRFFTLVIIFVICTVVFSSCTDESGPDFEIIDFNAEFKDTISGVEADETKYMNVTIVDEGVDIYAYEEGMTWGYRYGPTMMNYADGSMDAWFAAPAVAGPWDYLTYRHSEDGNSWSDEKVVLQPLADTMDYASVCDPGSVFFNGYYYLGYTSTIYGGGVSNNCFVARSRTPDGPYEKWNGSGWGGEPAPIVYYTDQHTAFGAGELSFVELDGTLYIYYTWRSPSEHKTCVSIADATDENWPATMEYKGVAMEYNIQDNEDSADVKYVEDYGKFIAINTTKRMSPDSAIQVWESNDGISFYRTNTLKTNIIYYCHNAGLMSRPNGHINLNDKLYLAYAYGGTSNDWGKWSTRIHEFTITLGDSIDTSDALNPNRKVDVEYWPHKEPWTVGITTNNLQHFERHLSSGEFMIELLAVDTTFTATAVTKASDVEFVDYDKSLVSFDGLMCKPKKVGSTYVTALYDGARHTFKITILSDDEFTNSNIKEMVDFRSAFIYPYDGPVKINKDGSVTMYLETNNEKLHIRSLAMFDDRNWMEITNLAGEFFDGTKYSYKITYTSSDKRIVYVSPSGVATAREKGSATVTVSCGKFSYDINITVI